MTNRSEISKIGIAYVMNKLRELGLTPIKENYYILVKETNKRVKVRTSSLKNEEFPEGKGIYYFGWTVKGRNKPVDYDILVGIGLEDVFSSPQCYIFTRNQALQVEDIGGYPLSVEKHIRVFKNKQTLKKAIKSKPDRVAEYVRYVNEHLDEFFERWDKIRSTD